MHNIFKTITIAILLFLLGIVVCTSDKPAYNTFGIYLNEDGSLILSDTDIEAYVKADHKIVLNQQGIIKWNSFTVYDSSLSPPIPKLASKLYKKEFSIRLDNDVMYTGKFWSYASSLTDSGIIIIDVLFALDSLHNWISIQNGYFPKSLPDLRDNKSIYDFFESKGKLK